MRLIPAFAFLVFPLLEIAGFVVVGGRIGVMATIGLILLSSVAGAVLLRWQGFNVIRRASLEMERGATPARELAHGVMVLLAGLLLLVPGFISSTIGLLLFIPPIRDIAWRHMGGEMLVMTRDGFGGQGRERQAPPDTDRVIDLGQDEYHQTRGAEKSPWRRKSDDK